MAIQICILQEDMIDRHPDKVNWLVEDDALVIVADTEKAVVDQEDLIVENDVLATVADKEMAVVDEHIQDSHNYILDCMEHLVHEADVDTEDDDSMEMIDQENTD